MKLRAEPKQVAVFMALLSVAGYFYFFTGRAAVREQAPKVAGEKRTSASLQDFKPSLKASKDGLDAATTDSGLRADLLGTVRNVNYGEKTISLEEGLQGS